MNNSVYGLRTCNKKMGTRENATHGDGGANYERSIAACRENLHDRTMKKVHFLTATTSTLLTFSRVVTEFQLNDEQ